MPAVRLRDWIAAHLAICWAQVWCLWQTFKGHDYRTFVESCDGKIYRVAAGTGNIFNATWRTVKVFYELVDRLA